MSKKLLYLISFVLVLGLAGNALAEDADPPPFAGAEGSGVARWEFDVEPPDPTAYGYYPAEPDPLLITQDMCVNTITWNEAEQTITHNDAESNWYMSTPDGEGEYLTIYGQVTHTAGDGALWPGVEMWENPRRSGGGYMGGQEGGGMDSWEVYEIETGVWQEVFYHTFFEPDGMPPLVSILLALNGDIQEIILDAVVHSGAEPPAGTGARPWGEVTNTKATNPSPADNATDLCPKVVLSWTPGAFVGALSSKHKVFFSENFDDVNDGNDVAKVAEQDPNYYPLSGTLSLDFGKTYYWKVDEANSTTGWDEGDIWQFTTEPIAYPIAGDKITATASSSMAANQGPENTINGSGLDANDLHSTVETDMWLSGSHQPGEAWIQYELDNVYKLHEMWVWNHNSGMEDTLGYGLKDVTIEYSENGADYTTLGTTHEFARAPGEANYEHNTEVYFGVPAKYVKLTANSNWEGKFDKYGLSEVRFFRIPVLAREESPESGTTIDGIDVVLSWRPGREAAEHYVYFSTSFEDVNTGTIAPDIIDAADGCRASYGPLSLDLGKTYYWKVNEVNLAEEPNTWPGDVWNFTTPEYLVVDDMEAYTDRQSIRAVWHDGYVATATSGSNVTVSTESDDRDPRLAGVGPPWPVRGSEAMQFAYDNDGSITLYVPGYAEYTYSANANYYSEIEASTSGPNSLEVGQDWASAEALSLWFYGDPNNDAEQMYVKLNGSKVVYDGDAGDVQQAGWHEWNIALSDFGVDLQNVTKVYIGFGDENNTTTPGGSGVVYFDDMRLYPSHCVLSKRSTDFARVDYVRDCVIDYKEVEVMAADWLFEATAPDAAHLFVEYTFNANNLIDTSGKNHHGIGQNTPSVHDGILTLDGTNFVDIPFGANNPFDGSQDFSIVMDFRTGQDGILISSARDANSENHAMAVYMWTDEVEGEVIYDNFYVASAGTGGETATGNNPGDGMWQSVVVTYDASEELVEIHMLDGEDWAWDGNFNPAIPNIADDTVRIGGSLNTEFPDVGNFVGDIDNVRVYDYVLSHEEALYISGLPVHDLNKDHIVNFKDFAELAAWWLDEQLWP